jgi:hypothetical protein
MGSNVKEAFAFSQRFTNQRDIAVFEITKSTVNEPARPGRNTGAEIFLLDERDPESPLGGVSRDAKAVNARANHNEVKVRGLRGLRGLFHEVSLEKMVTESFANT